MISTLLEILAGGTAEDVAVEELPQVSTLLEILVPDVAPTQGYAFRLMFQPFLRF
ncbi:MAG: hypothetical protein ACO2PM_22455 [Pyrobaculum sp.]